MFQRVPLVLIYHEIQTIFLGKINLRFFIRLPMDKPSVDKEIWSERNDFVTCLNIFLFRKSQSYAFIVDIYPLFHFLVLFSFWLASYIILAIRLFWRITRNPSCWTFPLFVGKPTVRDCQNSLKFDKSIFSNSSFSETTGLIHPSISQLETFYFLRSNTFENLAKLFLH